MGYRLADLHIYRSDQMREMARSQQNQVMTLHARRGLLLDRRGREMAASIEVDSIYAHPAAVEDPLGTAAVLAGPLDLDGRETRKLASRLGSGKTFIWIQRKVDPKVKQAVQDAVKKHSIKGIGFEREHKRFYPRGELAAHLLGWAGMDNEGMEGLELALDDVVAGSSGRVLALRDARGKKFMKLIQRAPQPGNSVVLAIDEPIQYIAQRELERAMEETRAAAGTVIVTDPRTGDILAMANLPTFNPNRPGDSPAAARKNRAVVDTYEPGSTLKVITMAAALEKGLVRPSEVIDCERGAIRIGRARIRDHKPFGLLTASEILQESSNVGAIKIGMRLGEQDLYDYLRRFGLGERTGIGLPGESRGLLREPARWSRVSQASLSFGQEIGVTPLQLVTAISAVANGGRLQPPRLVLSVLDTEGRVLEERAPRPSRRVIEEETARALRRMMLSVVEEGTAKAARIDGFSVAGKTGTAQKIGPEGTYSPDRFVASFAGFVPASRPELAILVVLDEPRGNLYHGGDIAAPVFRRIALSSLRYLGVAPDREPGLPGETDRGGEGAVAQASIEEPEAPVLPAAEDLPEPGSVVSGEEVLLADLRGQSLRSAVVYLSRVGLMARVAGEAASGGSVVRVIVAQQPEAGTILRHGDEVSLRPGTYVMN